MLGTFATVLVNVIPAIIEGGLINMGFRKYASAVENFASAVDKFDQQWRTTNTILVAMPFICFILMVLNKKGIAWGWWTFDFCLLAAPLEGLCSLSPQPLSPGGRRPTS